MRSLSPLVVCLDSRVSASFFFAFLVSFFAFFLSIGVSLIEESTEDAVTIDRLRPRQSEIDLARLGPLVVRAI